MKRSISKIKRSISSNTGKNTTKRTRNILSSIIGSIIKCTKINALKSTSTRRSILWSTRKSTRRRISRG